MKSGREELDSRPSFRELGVVVATAARIVGDLSTNAGLQRLLRVFLQLPRPDRIAVLGILEREVAERHASITAGDGLVGPPSGLGTIYVRLFENDVVVPQITRDDIVRSAIEAMALLAPFPAALAEKMESVLLAALEALTDGEAAALADVHDDVLALLGDGSS